MAIVDDGIGQLTLLIFFLCKAGNFSFRAIACNSFPLFLNEILANIKDSTALFVVPTID